uniref:Mannose-P-dolichol utilization defect 1 protein n=1 Tax=Coturnix japonica TaxID=93934 RepID=A0A8C2SRG2_COTJA
MLQTLIIAFLILHYRGRTVWGECPISDPSPISDPCPIRATSLQIHSQPPTPLSPLLLLQAAANHRQGHTGQLSALSSVLLLLGATARVFTSVQETGDPLLILTYLVSAACNALLVGQIFYYSRAVGQPHSKAE